MKLISLDQAFMPITHDYTVQQGSLASPFTQRFMIPLQYWALFSKIPQFSFTHFNREQFFYFNTLHFPFFSIALHSKIHDPTGRCAVKYPNSVLHPSIGNSFSKSFTPRFMIPLDAAVRFVKVLHFSKVFSNPKHCSFLQQCSGRFWQTSTWYQPHTSIANHSAKAGVPN